MQVFVLKHTSNIIKNMPCFPQIQVPEDEEISDADPENMEGLLLSEELRSGRSLDALHVIVALVSSI